MDRFINVSPFRPESFLSLVPGWDWSVNGYALIMIAWNILLAVLAVWLAWQLARALQAKRSVASLLIGLVWLLVLPNAAYIMTDGRHIIGYCPSDEFARVCQSHAWMTLFFFVYAAVGWYAFVQALQPVVAALAARWRMKAWLAAAAFSAVTALGVLLGLVNRWNSWEIVTDPSGIVRTAWQGLTDLTYLGNWLTMSVLLYLLYLAGARIFRPLSKR